MLTLKICSMRQDENKEMVRPALGITPHYFLVLHTSRSVLFNNGCEDIYEMVADCLAGVPGVYADSGVTDLEIEKFLITGPINGQHDIEDDTGVLASYRTFPGVAAWLELNGLEKAVFKTYKSVGALSRISQERKAISEYLYRCALYDYRP